MYAFSASVSLCFLSFSTWVQVLTTPTSTRIILCLVKINLESAVKANSDSNALLSHPFEDNRHVSDLNISAVVVSDMAGSCCVCDHSISRKDPQNMKKVMSW